MQVLVSSDTVMTFRIPILLYFGYSLATAGVFRQLPYICVYGTIGKMVTIAMSSVFTKYSFDFLLNFKITLSQAVIFCSVSNIIEPLNVFKFFQQTSSNNFYLLLGVFILGNATAVDVFNAYLRTAHLPKHVNVSIETYTFLLLKPVWDGVFGTLIGALVGFFIAIIARLNGKVRASEYVEIGLIISASCSVYFLSSFLRISTSKNSKMSSSRDCI